MRQKLIIYTEKQNITFSLKMQTKRDSILGIFTVKVSFICFFYKKINTEIQQKITFICDNLIH